MFKINIPNYVQVIMNELDDSGFESYLVGGCVRDSLLGNIPHDYDITTNATPSQMIECLTKFKIVETGIKHGTITIISDNQNVEVTTFRIDGEYKDNRRPENVCFTTSLFDDLKRRDFTVNALAYNNKVGLVDYFDGRTDLANKILRCVGNPDKRFNEDGLRILRCIRFASTLGFEIDEATSVSIHKNKGLLSNISVERIFVEFSKLLIGVNCEKILSEYSDVITQFVPEFEKCIGFNQNTKYHCYDVDKHIIVSVANSKPDVNIRLALFLHDIGKPLCYTEDDKGVGHFYGHSDVSAQISKEVLKRLKVDNKTFDFVTRAVKLHDREIMPTEKSVKRFLSKNSQEFLNDLLEIKKADAFAHAEKYRDRSEYIKQIKDIVTVINKKQECFCLKDLVVNGNDILNMGYNGVEVGKILNSVLNAVIDEKIKNDKREIEKYIKILNIGDK